MSRTASRRASEQMPHDPVVAIVGATGAVGAELISCLQRRGFPARALRLLASSRSAGRTLSFQGRPVIVEALDATAFAGVDLVFFAADADTSRTFAPLAAAAGALVVDNSSAFRADPDCPLVVPEVNPHALARHNGIIANPNCVAVIATVALAPLARDFGLRRVQMASYQAASGAGAAAMLELLEATRAHLEGRAYPPRVLPHPYAFNVFSHNDRVDLETGYNGEETKVMAETRRILSLPELPVGITAVRVPVLRAHCIALSVELEARWTVDAARESLAAAEGVRIVDNRAANHFPMPSEASGQDDVLAGRLRRDLSDPSGQTLALFVSGDQLLKGAALNAVQIAERVLASASRR